MITRRALKLGGTSLAALALPPAASAAAPRRGGTFTMRAWDPPHFDHVITHSFKTHAPISFTHSLLLRYRAGAAVRPGSLVIEGDLAESWTQPSETTWIFKLRRGVPFHARPPVNGRELTAEDVRFSVERFLTAPVSPNSAMLKAVDKVEPLKEPFAWFLDMMANPMALAITARECVEKFGDLKKPEAVTGTGPGMLEAYTPNHTPSPIYIGVWDGALKNYAPNLGVDYGGRVQAAWLER